MIKLPSFKQEKVYGTKDRTHFFTPEGLAKIVCDMTPEEKVAFKATLHPHVFPAVEVTYGEIVILVPIPFFIDVKPD